MTLVNQALRLWARSEWRRRRAALALISVIVAVGGGSTVAAAAAAHRTDTAFTRLEVDLHAAELAVQTAGEDGFADLPPRVLEDVMAVPGVRGAWALAFVFVAPEEYPNFFAVAVVDARGESPRTISVSGTGIDDIGEMRADEVLVNESMRDELGKGTGDTVVLRSVTMQQAIDSMAGGEVGEPDGPTITATIAGVARGLEEVSDAPDPFLLLPPAFYAEYGDEIGHCRCAVEINVEPDAVGAVRTTLIEMYPDADIVEQEDFEGRLADTVALQSRAWWLIALAAAAATIVALFQVAAGSVRSLARDDDTRRALGMTEHDRRRARMLVLAPAALGGAVAAIGVAYALSPLSPVGVTRRAEPAPGLRFDAGVVLPGAVAVLVGSLAVVAATAVLVSERTPRVATPDGLGRLIGGLGSRLALGPARGAILGVLLAVAGLVAAITLQHSIDHVLATPRLYGADFDAVQVIDDGQGKEAVAESLVGDPDIEAVGLVLTEKQDTATHVHLEYGGRTAQAEVKAIDGLKGVVTILVTQGRPPGRVDEVALGSRILDELGADIGDRLTATGSRGTVELTIVGDNLDPGVDDAGRGFGMTVDGMATLVEPVPEVVAVRFTPGADHEAVLARHADDFLRPMVPPSETGNIGELGGLPLRVGQLLTLLGIAALANGLVHATRRTRRDIAIHRALGFTSRQVVGTHLWAGLLIGAIGAVLGGAIGFVIGRAILRPLVTNVGAIPVTVVPGAVWLAGTAAVAVCVLAGSVAGGLVLRHRPGAVLRAE